MRKGGKLDRENNKTQKIEAYVKNKKCRFGRHLSTSLACSYPGVCAGWPKTRTSHVLRNLVYSMY